MLKVQDGKIVDGKINLQIESKIEHGELKTISALIMHQTGGSDAAGTLASYKTSQFGAHFLVGKDGKIYQTARVNQQCWHIGLIRSRCQTVQTCDPADAAAIDTIMKAKISYKAKISKLNEHESKKSYPARYPTNADSLGIEVVGAVKDGKYEDPSADQNTSICWLVAELLDLYKLTSSDVYRHPDVSYKNESEAKGVTW